MPSFMANYIPCTNPAIATAVDAYVGAWLTGTVNTIAQKAQTLCKAKNAGITVTIQPAGFVGSNRAYISIFQIGGELPHDRIEQWAFDYTFTVPLGGFVAPNPPGYFMYRYPGGVYRKMKRAYFNQGGMTITRRGYMTQAIENTFTQAYLDVFGTLMGRFTGTIVAENLVNEAKSKGLQAHRI